MKIIEKTVVAKSPTRKSEDGIVITPDFVAVIDGSTSKTARRLRPWLTNGRLAMLIVSRYIRRMPKDTSCHQFCQGATAAIHRRYRLPLVPWLTPRSRLQRFVDHPEERATCSCIVYSRVRREIWFVGDCQCLVDGQPFDCPKPYEQHLSDLRAARVRELLAQGMSQEEQLLSDPAREVVIAPLLESMREQNVSFAVIDGFRIPEQHVPVLTLDFHDHDIVLASDGYPRLRPTLAESERQLDLQRRQDPLNIGLPIEDDAPAIEASEADVPAPFRATKAFLRGANSFDDRSYVRFHA